MNADIKRLLCALPSKIAWSDIVQFEYIDERVLAANHLCGDIIGMCEGYVEWCPNHNPPSVAETLVWWWVIRPDLGAAIAYGATDEIRDVIAQYIMENHQPTSLAVG